MEKVYLAHTLGHRHYVKKTIQPMVAAYYEVINPFDKNEDEITDEMSDNEVRERIKNAERLVQNDLDLIDEAKNLIAYVENPSFGTCFEIAYARQKGYPILICTKQVDHPWVEVYGDVQCEPADFNYALVDFNDGNY